MRKALKWNGIIKGAKTVGPVWQKAECNCKNNCYKNCDTFWNTRITGR